MKKSKVIKLLEKLKLQSLTKEFCRYSGWDASYLSHLLSGRRQVPIGHEETIVKDIEEFFKIKKKE